MAGGKLYTRTGTSTATDVIVRGRDLTALVGNVTFTEMLYFLTCDRMPTARQTRLLDACLVTLMEHGLTPSAVITRLMADSVPEEPQVAIASGLLAIGSVYAGTTEQCAGLLVELDKEKSAGGDRWKQLIGEYAARTKHVPGFGHGTHKPDDPRAQRLFSIVQAEGGSRFVEILMALGVEVDRVAGRHITINATGAIAALLLEIDVPTTAMRAFSVVSRAGGLVGHLLEEKAQRSGEAIWHAAKDCVPYREQDELD